MPSENAGCEKQLCCSPAVSLQEIFTPILSPSLLVRNMGFPGGASGKVKIAQSCPTLCHLKGCTVHGILQARILPNPGIEPRSPTSQADSLPAEPQGKPKNTGVGSLSLLQKIFPTQESNQGLLHHRWILYQLSYEGSEGHFNKVTFGLNSCLIFYL